MLGLRKWFLTDVEKSELTFFVTPRLYHPFSLPVADERDQLLAEVDRIHNRNQLDQSGASKKTSGSSDNEEEEEEESLDCIVKVFML